MLQLDETFRTKEIFDNLFFYSYGFESKRFFCSFFVILTLGFGSVDPHIFANPDSGSKNVADPTDPDPKHCFFVPISELNIKSKLCAKCPPSNFTVLRIRILKILAFWIRIRKNMQIHGSGSKG